MKYGAILCKGNCLFVLFMVVYHALYIGGSCSEKVEFSSESVPSGD